jgi:acetyltransferase-like isoleucine patch superfamily enzyme
MSWRQELGRRRRAAVAELIQRAWRYAEQAAPITAETAAGRRFAAFGAGSLIAFPPGSIYGERWIEVGSGSMFAANVTLCAGLAPGHDLGPSPVLRVGDRCVIGRGSHIVAHHRLEIGDDVYTGPYVYITDQNHSYADPDAPIGSQWPVNSAVSIGSGSWLGTGAIILPGAVIGRNVVVAAGAVVRGKIPDRCVVAGVPARVVREHIPGVGWTQARDLAGEALSSLSPPPAPTPSAAGPTARPAARPAARPTVPPAPSVPPAP